MKLKRTYSSREVASLTGLTARQLQLWDQSGLVAAAIPTHKTDAGGYTERRYTPIELFELLVLADLRRRGFSVHQLHQILEVLRHRFGAATQYTATIFFFVTRLLGSGVRFMVAALAANSAARFSFCTLARAMPQ